MPVLRGRPAGAALVEQQHAVAPQGPLQPAGRVGAGARRAATGAALQEQQVGLLDLGEVGRPQLAGVHLDALTARVLRVERHLHDVVAGEHATAVGRLAEPADGARLRAGG